MAPVATDHLSDLLDLRRGNDWRRRTRLEGEERDAGGISARCGCSVYRRACDGVWRINLCHQRACPERGDLEHHFALHLVGPSPPDEELRAQPLERASFYAGAPVSPIEAEPPRNLVPSLFRKRTNRSAIAVAFDRLFDGPRP